MNIFINTISTNAIIILFDNNRDIIKQKNIEIKGNESSKLIPFLEDFLKENKLSYKDIKNTIVVNGPGSFTWVRTTVLAINTINFITKNNLTPISYFNLFNDFPIVKSSSKRDCFYKDSKDSKIEIKTNEDIYSELKNKKIQNIYWEADLEDIEIIEKIDYSDIIKKIKLLELKKVEPLYIKKPNIS